MDQGVSISVKVLENVTLGSPPKERQLGRKLVGQRTLVRTTFFCWIYLKNKPLNKYSTANVLPVRGQEVVSDVNTLVTEVLLLWRGLLGS